ncbi:hypothetical protein MNBD_NITROSPIRAE01-2035 [hydrothermal vent metagenome]|uniref:Uncharacterized protein n=1 Tax=hydrothermal vent metagenome TaxID=652676 RepID=A0A3B1DC94_9ZZZZ
MRIHKLVLPIFLGSVLLSGTAYSQQIETNTSATTQGSTQFGFLPNGADLGVFMQTTVAPTCTTVSTNVQSCGSDGGTAVGDNDNFVRVDQMPGSFTDSPIPGDVSTLPNFACGPAVSHVDCLSLLNTIGSGSPNVGGSQTAPRVFGGIPGTSLDGRDFLGNVGSSIVIGDGGATAGMPDGFISTSITRAAFGAVRVGIDQGIDHTIDLGGGSLMTVSTTTNGSVLSFNAQRDTVPNGSCFAIGTCLTTTLDINQGPADGFGALTLSSSAGFIGSPLSGNPQSPGAGAFVTPGLNTGIAPAVGDFDDAFGVAPCAPNTCFGFP